MFSICIYRIRNDTARSLAPSKFTAKDLQSLLNRLELLLARLTGGLAEDQLGLELPVGGDAPSACNLLVNERVVMLQVSPETFLFECCPCCIQVSMLFPM